MFLRGAEKVFSEAVDSIFEEHRGNRSSLDAQILWAIF